MEKRKPRGKRQGGQGSGYAIPPFGQIDARLCDMLEEVGRTGRSSTAARDVIATARMSTLLDATRSRANGLQGRRLTDPRTGEAVPEGVPVVCRYSGELAGVLHLSDRGLRCYLSRAKATGYLLEVSRGMASCPGHPKGIPPVYALSCHLRAEAAARDERADAPGIVVTVPRAPWLDGGGDAE